MNKCNLSTSKCVYCLKDSDCPNANNVCSDANVCVDGSVGSNCSNNSECIGVCDPINKKCTNCVLDSDCSNSLYCDVKTANSVTDNVCVACVNNT